MVGDDGTSLRTKRINEVAMPTELEDYLFDLSGYLVLEKAVSTDHIHQLNTDLDPYVSMKLGEWRQNVHRL